MRETKVVVIGAGINGLCTAWQLAQKLAGPDILLIDRLPAGHDRGSSHGEERITRSTYESVEWVRAMQRAHGELWPALEAELGRTLIVPGRAVFWGPESGPIGAYAQAVAAAGARVDEIDRAAARRRFPGMTFAGAERVLLDHTAGIIAAGAAVRGLEGWLEMRGVERMRGCVAALERAGDGVTLRVDAEVSVRAEAVVVAAGPWLGLLLPDFATRVVATRQDVGFWKMNAEPGRTPCWVYLGEHQIQYGLPALSGGEMKSAFHRRAEPLDPDDPHRHDPQETRTAREAVLAALEANLRTWFTPGPKRRTRSETCFFTMAPSDGFLIEPVVGHDRVLVASACSGHGFKLAPLTGETAALWALERLA